MMVMVMYSRHYKHCSDGFLISFLVYRTQHFVGEDGVFSFVFQRISVNLESFNSVLVNDSDTFPLHDFQDL